MSVSDRVLLVLGRRLSIGLLAALALMLLYAGLPVKAQPAPQGGELAVRSDGFLYWMSDGIRQVIYPVTMPDEQINALREGPPLNAALQPGQLVGEGGFLAVRSDGFIFWIGAGSRHAVYPANYSDQQIMSRLEGVPLDAALRAGASQPLAGPLPTGSSRADRLLPGQTCNCSRVRPTGEQITLQIRLAGFERGAWDRLRRINPLNQPPRAGFDYVSALISINYVQGPSDIPISIDRFDFTMIDANDVLYPPAFVVEQDQISSAIAYPGSQTTGSIAFEVPTAQLDRLVLVWHYNDDTPAWFGIPSQ
jgi:hypothetical protein